MERELSLSPAVAGTAQVIMSCVSGVGTQVRTAMAAG